MARPKVLVILLLLLCTQAFGVEDERRKPLEPEPPKPKPPVAIPETKPEIADDTKVLVEKLLGVRFIGKTEDVQKQAVVEGVAVDGVALLNTDEFKKRIEPFVGKPISLKAIKEIARVAILYCREQDRPFVNVSIPEQDITKGVLQILVVEGKVGKVDVEGNKWFRTKQFLSQIGLKPGDSISEKRIIRDIDYLNQNAFRQVRPVFKPGTEPGTTELTLKVDDRFPVRFYAGYEDTGTQLTGIDRLITGFNWQNGFQAGHEIGYQFAADIKFEKLLSHSGYWRIPLPNRDKLALTWGITETAAPVNQDLNTTGLSWQAGLRYIKTLPHVGILRHDFQAGFDLKQTNNNLEFGGTEIFASEIRVAQLALSYHGGEYDRWGNTTFALNGFFSPGHSTAFQTGKAYKTARERTDPRYNYESVNFERIWKLPKGITLVNQVNGQLSDERLQSSEQLLLGGIGTVRGYDDRLISCDEGFSAGTELRSPFLLLGKIKNDDRFEGRMQFVAFWEYGLAYNISHAANERKFTDLESVGGGIRFKLGNYLNVRFDYGHKLMMLAPHLDNGRDPGRIHLSVVGSF
ncbi:MAG: ShlB/FhaC/HecB family hemolysin secretion/activation protein [Planctomycetes bacterium]|nr:ShlB/FhaC/HecB family hemolysin secretion/activation protein [Planctomycetota bacterium]